MNFNWGTEKGGNREGVKNRHTPSAWLCGVYSCARSERKGLSLVLAESSTLQHIFTNIYRVAPLLIIIFGLLVIIVIT